MIRRKSKRRLVSLDDGPEIDLDNLTEANQVEIAAFLLKMASGPDEADPVPMGESHVRYHLTGNKIYPAACPIGHWPSRSLQHRGWTAAKGFHSRRSTLSEDEAVADHWSHLFNGYSDLVEMLISESVELPASEVRRLIGNTLSNYRTRDQLPAVLVRHLEREPEPMSHAQQNTCQLQISAKAFAILWERRPHNWPRECYVLMDDLRKNKVEWGTGYAHQSGDANLAAAQRLAADLEAAADANAENPLPANDRRDAKRAAASIRKRVEKVQARIDASNGARNEAMAQDGDGGAIDAED